MCLCFLTDKDRYFTIDLLGEYIYLSIDDEGHVQVREIYDVFFTPRDDWPDLRLLCLSPHDLVSGGNLAVQSQDAPGMRPEDRVIYNPTMGCEASYDPPSQVFSVKVPGVTDRFRPIQEKHAGVAISAQVSVPNQVQNDPGAVDVMIVSGTVFEVALGNVEAGKTYALRLEITPYDLLGLPDRNSLGMEPYPQWSQEAYILGPKLCHFNCISTLHDIQQKQSGTPAAVGAAIIDGTISNEHHPRVLVPLSHHRILLLSEPPTLVDPRSPVGCVTPVGASNVQQRNVATEWAGGTGTYWIDDIECTAEKIWVYLSVYAAAEAKSKEAITAALGLSHDNCGLIVNALVQAGAVCETSANLYQAIDLPESQRKQIFEALATDEHLIEEFLWRCYQISYLCTYPYLSPEDARRLWWRRIKQDWGFWLAVVGVILSLVGLLLQWW